MGQDRFQEVGRTEMVKDSLNPQWVRKIEIDYRFEERQVGCQDTCVCVCVWYFYLIFGVCGVKM